MFPGEGRNTTCFFLFFQNLRPWICNSQVFWHHALYRMRNSIRHARKQVHGQLVEEQLSRVLDSVADQMLMVDSAIAQRTLVYTWMNKQSKIVRIMSMFQQLIEYTRHPTLGHCTRHRPLNANHGLQLSSSHGAMN